MESSEKHNLQYDMVDAFRYRVSGGQCDGVGVGAGLTKNVFPKHTQLCTCSKRKHESTEFGCKGRLK